MTEGGTDDKERIRHAFRRCVAREPMDDEAHVLAVFLAEQRKRFESGVDPWPLITDEDERPAELPGGGSAPELAAWIALARVVLNLDETITKE